MNIEIDYQTFCNNYYEMAEQVADITVAEHIKNHGEPSRFIDLDLVKDLGISYGLEKAYYNFDINRKNIEEEKADPIKPFLYKVVHNCVLTELRREAGAVGGGNRPEKSVDSMNLAATIGGGFASLRSFSATIKTSGRFKKKEDLIAKMLECIKQLKGVDQVIITCWMYYPKREYTDVAIEELGWENNARTRNVVYVRCNRAMAMLGKMMKGAKKNLEPTLEPKASSSVDSDLICKRQLAAKKAITKNIDYDSIAKTIASSLSD